MSDLTFHFYFFLFNKQWEGRSVLIGVNWLQRREEKKRGFLKNVCVHASAKREL